MSYHFTRKTEDLKGAAEFKLFKSKYAPDENGYYGKFGGAYIPEMLHRNVEELRTKYNIAPSEIDAILDPPGKRSLLFQVRELTFATARHESNLRDRC